MNQEEWIMKIAVSVLMACVMAVSVMAEDKAPRSFGEDLAFLKKHTDVLVLENGDSKVAVVPQYQGRVMTSTADGDRGASYGFLNYKVIEAGILSDKEKKGKLEEHIYVFGGEERFWMGPEGGQFAIYFKPGAKFEFSDWFTPAAIDTDAYKLEKKTETKAVFHHDCELLNHSGTKFTVGIDRTVKLLSAQDVEEVIGTALPKGVKVVGYETDNRITNNGKQAWTEKTGMLSIWMLGMYKPAPKTVVVIPFKGGPASELGPKVNDTYFGKVPADYLKVKDDVLFFKGDGTRRGKIGISPQRSKGVAGSYDADGQMLTLVTYDQPTTYPGYVNSMWEFQKEPFKGDAVNSYNDGSPAPNTPPLGPFYELETSSPAADLKPGKTLKHVQQTLHIQGPEKLLDPLVRHTLGVSINDIKEVF